MNEFEARILEKLMDENNELKKELTDVNARTKDYWSVSHERNQLKARLEKVEGVLTPKQREKLSD